MGQKKHKYNVKLTSEERAKLNRTQRWPVA